MSTWWRVPAVVAAATLAYLAPLVPVTLARPDERGLRSLDDAVLAARATGLEGMPLVDAARRIVGEQFLTYSAQLPFESTERAFARRRGYSAQYNVALAEVLKRLGFDARTVFASRVADRRERPWWRNAHVWVRVRVDGRVRDVCAGLTGPDGRLLFTPLTEVREFGTRTHRNTTTFLTFFAAYQQWRHLLQRRPMPRWMRRPFHEGR